MDCQTQWKYVVGSKLVRLGLDYAQLWAVMQIRNIREPSEMFDKIRLIERGALAGLNDIPLETLLDG
jgi:hypothetical protein